MRVFWPPAEGAQADYERLRAGVLSGTPAADAAARRFARGGLQALIDGPQGDPVFVVVLTGASRPAWTPQFDPRREALAAGYALLLGCADEESTHRIEEVAR